MLNSGAQDVLPTAPPCNGRTVLSAARRSATSGHKTQPQSWRSSAIADCGRHDARLGYAPAMLEDTSNNMVKGAGQGVLHPAASPQGSHTATPTTTTGGTISEMFEIPGKEGRGDRRETERRDPPRTVGRQCQTRCVGCGCGLHVLVTSGRMSFRRKFEEICAWRQRTTRQTRCW